MKYIFYSIYKYYTFIWRVQEHWPPIISVTGLLATLQLFYIFIVIDIIIFVKTGTVETNIILPFIIFLFLYWFNYYYFSKREKIIIDELSMLNEINKILMYSISTCIILIGIWGYVFNGFIELLK